VTTLGPLPRSSVPDRVFARLCELIITGEYEPGERLPTQRTLAAEFGVNMASVREAVKRLEQLGLVEVRHGDAMRVLNWRDSGIEVLPLIGTIDESVVRPLFESRRMILAQVARLAAERRGDEQAETVAATAREFAAAQSEEAAQLADWAFVSAVVEASGNLILQLLGNSVRKLYLGNATLFQAIITRPDELDPLYTAVANAIVDRDPDAAERAMTELATAHERRMLEAI
jgi:DNA-binding FadR family transcriptional regulator